jgi:N-acetylglucosamine kinase-like BadF-type ATPase
MAVFVGLDCGGSSSRVLAVDSDGEIVFQGQSGAANLASTPENRLRKNLAHATDGCPHADYVCGCFAGLVNEDLRKRGIEFLRQLFPGAEVRAEPDFTAALYAAPEGTDICVIAGTGSLVCSRSQDGIVKSGGRGYILGDYGSGYHYGRDALLHYLDHPDEASDQLKQIVRETFDSSEEGVIVASVYRTNTPATMLGRLSKALASDAKAGKKYALDSVRRNSHKLAQVVQGHIDKHMPSKDQIGISVAGGVWKAAPIFRERFEASLEELMPSRSIVVHRVTRPPLYGAVELAKEMSIGN